MRVFAESRFDLDPSCYIAEGYGRKTTLEYIRFLYAAYGSNCEVETKLLLSEDLGYIKVEKLKKLKTDIGAVERIKGMNNEKRSGDIVLIMKDATSGDAINRYTTGVACKSWHGSLNKSDSYVPFIVAYPGGHKYEFDAILNTVCPGNNCEGNWKLTDLIKEIVKNQYSGQ